MASLSYDESGWRLRFYLDKTPKTLRLGKASKKDATTAAHMIERLIAARRLGATPDSQTIAWLARIGDDLHARLARLGLVEPRRNETLGAFLERWLQSRQGYKASSQTVWRQVTCDLRRFFGDDCPLKGINQERAEAFRQHLINRRLRDTTIQKRLQHCRTIFKAALRDGLIQSNPFEYVRHRGGNVAERRTYVTREEALRVIEHCPDIYWQLLVALARFAGLRTPSESLSLRWADIDWADGRMYVHEPKVEHHPGRGLRAVPLFPDVRVWLERAWEMAPEGAEYVFPEDMRKRAMGPEGWRNANLRTRMAKIVRRAGLQPWPRLFHSLRASCETDLVRQFPLPVVAKWLGNTSMIALRHYVDVTDEHFRQAADMAKSPAIIPAINPAMQTPATTGTEEKHTSKTPVFTALFTTLLPSANTLLEDRGFEPLTS